MGLLSLYITFRPKKGHSLVYAEESDHRSNCDLVVLQYGLGGGLGLVVGGFFYKSESRNTANPLRSKEEERAGRYSSHQADEGETFGLWGASSARKKIIIGLGRCAEGEATISHHFSGSEDGTKRRIVAGPSSRLECCRQENDIACVIDAVSRGLALSGE